MKESESFCAKQTAFVSLCEMLKSFCEMIFHGFCILGSSPRFNIWSCAQHTLLVTVEVFAPRPRLWPRPRPRADGFVLSGLAGLKRQKHNRVIVIVIHCHLIPSRQCQYTRLYIEIYIATQVKHALFMPSVKVFA